MIYSRHRKSKYLLLMSDICKNNLNDRHAAAAAHLPSKPFFRSRHIWNGVRQCIPCCREPQKFIVCKRIANGGHFFSYVRNLTFFALRTIKKPKDFFKPQLAACTPVRSALKTNERLTLPLQAFITIILVISKENHNFALTLESVLLPSTHFPFKRYPSKRLQF